jgi:hypothetical protein
LISRELEREKLQARLGLVPLLMSEQDFEHCKMILENEKIEKAVGAKPWNPQVYSKSPNAPRSLVTNESGSIEFLPFYYDLYINDDDRPVSIKFS